jgi:hypothetical protein
MGMPADVYICLVLSICGVMSLLGALFNTRKR